MATDSLVPVITAKTPERAGVASFSNVVLLAPAFKSTAHARLSEILVLIEGLSSVGAVASGLACRNELAPDALPSLHRVVRRLALEAREVAGAVFEQYRVEVTHG